MDSERKSALSFRDLERLGEGAVKKAFRSFRQILIVLLYVVAIFFVLNDFSFTVTSAEQFVADKAPWVVLYILAHYFCRDYGIQKGREDEEYKAVEKRYRELCDGARGKRKEMEAYCKELEAYYNGMRLSETLSALGVSVDENAEPITDGLDKRTKRAVRRALKRKPIRITYRMLIDRAERVSKSVRPIKPSFESYMRRTSLVSVLKIILLSFFTFSLTATLGEDPWSNFLNGVPYLVTMLSVSITAVLGAYRSVLTYDVDCINDRIAVIEGMGG